MNSLFNSKDNSLTAVAPDEILQYCLENLPETVFHSCYGEKCIFYNPENKLKHGIYVLTIKEKDGNNDKSSNLNREGIYRINFGIKKNTFINQFEFIPARPLKGNTVDMQYDFSTLNKLIPHPVYSYMAWVCILNPDKNSFNNIKKFINESYECAKEKYNKKTKI